MTVDPIDFTLGNIRPDRQLHYENYQLVSAVQALWGAISPNMVAVSLSCVGHEVHMHFYLEADSLIDREGIDDVATDLEALQFTSVPIHTHVSVVGARISWRDIEGRSIYRRYEGPSVG